MNKATTLILLIALSTSLVLAGCSDLEDTGDESGSNDESSSNDARDADSDGDGVPDDEDDCPGTTDDSKGILQKGDTIYTAKGLGCYDSDGDGYPDAQDACPYKPGSNGHECPQNDGLQDGDGFRGL